MLARNVLHKLLQKVCPGMHKMRRTALFVNVMATLHGEVLTVTHLGRAIRIEAKEKHCIKRADRLLSNRRLQGERVQIYTALAQQLIGNKQRPVLIIDWSDMDECKRHFLLRASVPIEGHSLTLYEEVHTVKSNGGVGIEVGGNCLITGSTASFNGGQGISAAEDSVVTGNTASFNRSIGIFASGTVIGNTASFNGDVGIGSGAALDNMDSRGHDDVRRVREVGFVRSASARPLENRARHVTSGLCFIRWKTDHAAARATRVRRLGPAYQSFGELRVYLPQLSSPLGAVTRFAQQPAQSGPRAQLD